MNLGELHELGLYYMATLTFLQHALTQEANETCGTVQYTKKPELYGLNNCAHIANVSKNTIEECTVFCSSSKQEVNAINWTPGSRVCNCQNCTSSSGIRMGTFADNVDVYFISDKFRCAEFPNVHRLNDCPNRLDSECTFACDEGFSGSGSGSTRARCALVEDQGASGTKTKYFDVKWTTPAPTCKPPANYEPLIVTVVVLVVIITCGVVIWCKFRKQCEEHCCQAFCVKRMVGRSSRTY